MFPRLSKPTKPPLHVAPDEEEEEEEENMLEKALEAVSKLFGLPRRKRRRAEEVRRLALPATVTTAADTTDFETETAPKKFDEIN